LAPVAEAKVMSSQSFGFVTFMDPLMAADVLAVRQAQPMLTDAATSHVVVYGCRAGLSGSIRRQHSAVWLDAKLTVGSGSRDTTPIVRWSSVSRWAHGTAACAGLHGPTGRPCLSAAACCT
jgi:hypothetical protein